jgi:hypothetical protein
MSQTEYKDVIKCKYSFQFLAYDLLNASFLVSLMNDSIQMTTAGVLYFLYEKNVTLNWTVLSLPFIH